MLHGPGCFLLILHRSITNKLIIFHLYAKFYFLVNAAEIWTEPQTNKKIMKSDIYNLLGVK